MSGRRAKQQRRLERLAESGRPERTRERLPKRGPAPELVGWTERARIVNRAQEKARRLRQMGGSQ